jgi:penicillin-binding protein 2
VAGPSVALKDHWQEQRLFLSRIIAAAIVVLLLTGLLVARLVQLQVIDYERFSELSQGNRFRIEPLPPNRGLILDRNGRVIADNTPNWELVAVSEEIEDLEATLDALEQLELTDPSEHNTLRDLVRSHRGFERVKLANLTEEQAATFAVRRHRFSGVDIQEALVRSYPFGEASAHAVGYVGALSPQDYERVDRRDYAATSQIGKSGVERAFEATLHGRVGYRQQVVNAQGRVLFDPTVNGEGEEAKKALAGVESRAPVPGKNVVLSLDMNLQLAAQDALGELRGAAVAIDTRNGDVLALVSTPSFDPNRFANGISRTDYVALNTDPDKPLLNRALTGVYPPGSTVKPFIGLTALLHESIDPHKEIYCPGEYRIPGFTHRYREGRGGVHGGTDLHEAIVRSCDVYFYQLALAIGIDDLSAGLRSFGFGAPTGLDIGGERSGILPSPEWKKRNFSRREDQVWFPGETVNTGVGQGYMTVTPLQLAHAEATLAARGIGFKPRLLIGVEDSITREVTYSEPVALEPIEDYTPEHWDFVRDAMIGVTSEQGGTALAAMKGTTYTVAGKTGTAQVFTVAQDEKYREEDVDERLRDHGLFVAFAPAEAPRIALAVVVENGGGGARAAAPVARKIFDAYFATEGGGPPLVGRVADRDVASEAYVASER